MAQFYKSICVIFLIFFVSMTHAQDDPGFSGRAGLGFLATSGNSDTQSLNGNLDMWLNFDSWRHAVNAQAIKSKTSGTTTSEAIGWSWQSDYTINETDYIFGITAIDKDEFSTYDQQTRIAFGYGRRVIDLERHVLNAEVGFGSRQADLRNKTSQDGAILRWSGDYRWIISDVSEFNQTLSIEGGADNVFLESSSALSTNVRENLALVTSFAIKSNSDVLPGSKKTDTFTAISLEYTF
ncbi:MAG: DUF481 domain-containing protein [Gammaproteobacteria bacterium]|nr:DUF481 domain-containing protein [Gammaproteobacteria bacterium]